MLQMFAVICFIMKDNNPHFYKDHGFSKPLIDNIYLITDNNWSLWRNHGAEIKVIQSYFGFDYTYAIGKYTLVMYIFIY